MAEGQGRSSNQGVKLLYIRDYLHKYTNKEHPKSAKEISEYLASKGIKADRKTIYNDILRLQVDFQEPIEYNPKKWGYYITKPQLSGYELRMLLDSVQLTQMLTTEETRVITDKILEFTNVYDKLDYSDELKRRKPSNKADHSVIRNAELIRQAVTENKKVRFRYYRYVMDRGNKNKEYISDEKSGDIIVVSPKELVWRHGKYVMIPFSEDVCHRNYRLEFMEDVTILTQESEHLKLKTIDRGISGSSELILKRDEYEFDAHKKYAVTMLVPEPLIEEVFHYWGSDTSIIPYDRFNVMFTVHTELDHSFFLWVLSMRDRIKILAPKEAIGELCLFLRQITDMYEYGKTSYLKNIPTTYDEMREQKHGFKRQLRYINRKP